MDGSHEYSIQGHSRTNLGRHMGVVASAAAASSALLAPTVVFTLTNFGILDSVPEIIFWPVTAGFFYIFIHWVFDRYLWRIKWLAKLFGLPVLSGTWRCEGESFDDQNNSLGKWSGKVLVFQTWEKIRIYLDTGQSSSVSCVASISPETEKGFKLIYSYRNVPKVGENLDIHLGFAEIAFNKETSKSNGEYYNLKGRFTRGRMQWIKE